MNVNEYKIPFLFIKHEQFIIDSFNYNRTNDRK